jgi:hypothetical protein
MSKRWYNYFVSTGEGQQDTNRQDEDSTTGGPNPPGNAAQTVAAIAAAVNVAPNFSSSVTTSNSFDEIYKAAEILPPAHGYTVFKVAEMLHSSHIRELPREIKRSSVLVALDASGVKVQDIVTDAVRRDKALDTFESIQRRAVEQLEAKKTEENRQAQAEVDRLIGEFRSRIQANNEAVAREKERFQAWLQQKQQEEQKIADTIGYFVSENPVTVGATAAPPAKKENS